VRDLTGKIKVWIEIGFPDAAKLHKASKASPRVVVFTHKDPELMLARLAGEKIHRVEALELYALDREWLASLMEKLERRMAFALTISERNLYLSFADETMCTVIRKLNLS
jgi:uncharacterized protein YaeQ